MRTTTMSSTSLLAAAPTRRRPATAERPVGQRGNRRVSLRWISPLLLVALWQLASAVGVLSPDKLAAPSTIASTAWELTRNGQLPDALAVSLRRVAIGVAVGVTVGLALGAMSGLSRWGEGLLDPLVQMVRTLPFLGLVPLFILWFGIGESPKIALVALGAAFPVYLNAHAAIRGTDPKLLDVARVLGLSRSERLRHLILPAAAPQTLVGLRQSLGIAWLSIIVAEQINADSGLGYLINDARDFLRTDVIVVGLLVYAALGLITDALVRLAERRLLVWRGTETVR
jgi:sulfonate transport system permease protein